MKSIIKNSKSAVECAVITYNGLFALLWGLYMYFCLGVKYTSFLLNVILQGSKYMMYVHLYTNLLWGILAAYIQQ